LLRKIIKAATKRGAVCEESKGGSSHSKFFLDNGKMYPVPAPNGRKSKIKYNYVRGLCKAAGWVPAEFIEDI